jgi:hypothetical protein
LQTDAAIATDQGTTKSAENDSHRVSASIPSSSSARNRSRLISGPGTPGGRGRAGSACGHPGSVRRAGPGAVFSALFPPQVDRGTRKPNTWTWMLRRIRDGNDVLAPRNLIDLVKKAQTAQLKREERDLRELQPGVPLMISESLRLALEMLSAERVEDTLLAEGGESAQLIEKFRGGNVATRRASRLGLFD